MTKHQTKPSFHLALRSLAASFGMTAFLPILAYASNEDDPNPKESNAAERYQQITSEYQKQLVKLQRTKAGTPALIALGKERDRQFAQLLRESKSNDDATVSVGDLVALASCCEYLRRREACLEYCQKAVATDAQDPTIYFPYVRTLLNLNRDDEAERVLAAAEKRFPNTSPVLVLHGLLFKKFQWSNKQQQAAYHVAALMEYYFATLESSPSQAKFAAANLQAYVDLRQTEATPQELSEDLKRFLRVVDHALAAETGSGRNSNHVHKWAAQEPAVHLLRCEIIRCSSSSQFSNALTAWFDDFSVALEQHPQPQVIHAALHNAAGYAAAHSHLISDAADLSAKIDQLLKQHLKITKDNKNGSIAELAAKSLRRLIHIIDLQAETASRVGQQVDSSKEWHWLVNGDSVVKTKKPTDSMILYCWNPWMPDGFSGLRSLPTIEARLEKLNVKLICVAPYSGFNWDPKAYRVNRESELPAAEERKALTKFLRAQKASLPCALYTSESPLNEIVDASSTELMFLVVDKDQTLRRIVVGRSPAKLRLLIDSVTP